MSAQSCVVYAGNLSWMTTEEQLLAFAKVGCGAISTEIKRHKDTKRSKGWGLIYYSSAELAEAAVVELNSSELNDRLLHLRIDREGQTNPEGASSVYVGNLPWQVTEEELESAFAAFKPYYCRVMKNMSGRSRGFAILKFHCEADALLAISSMNSIQIGGRVIECRDDRGRSFDASTKRALFVGKLDLTVTDETLALLFGGAGEVTSAKIQIKPDGTPKGWGVVKFKSSKDAEAAIEMFNGKVQTEGPALEVRYDKTRK